MEIWALGGIDRPLAENGRVQLQNKQGTVPGRTYASRRLLKPLTIYRSLRMTYEDMAHTILKGGSSCMLQPRVYFTTTKYVISIAEQWLDDADRKTAQASNDLLLRQSTRGEQPYNHPALWHTQIHIVLHQLYFLQRQQPHQHIPPITHEPLRSRRLPASNGRNIFDSC